MDAPTSSHKRVGLLSNSKNLLSPSSPFDYDSSRGLHAAERFKSSHNRMSPDPDRRDSRPNTDDRVHQYPPVSEPFRRPVHALGRSFKLGNLFRKVESKMKLEELEEAKKVAFANLRYANQDNEIVDVHRECSNSKAILDWNVDRGVQRAQKSLETKEDVYVKENFADYGFRGSSSMVSDLNNQTPKDDDDDDCAIMSMSPGELTEPPHRRLYADRERRNSKISHLRWLVSLLNARSRSGRSKPLVKLGNSFPKAESRKKVEEL